MIDPITIIDSDVEPAPGADRFARLRNADAEENPARMIATLRAILYEDRELTFQSLEGDLRSLGCQTHLIASPSSHWDRNEGVSARDRYNRVRTFALYIAGSPEKAAMRLREINVSVEQNLRNLRDTGILVADKGAARAIDKVRRDRQSKRNPRKP